MLPRRFRITFDLITLKEPSCSNSSWSAVWILQKCIPKWYFIEETTEQIIYDPEAKQFLADRYVTGNLPKLWPWRKHMEGPSEKNCGSTLKKMLADLIHSKSTNFWRYSPHLKETKHLFLPLDRYEDLSEKKWILEGHKNDWKSLMCTDNGKSLDWWRTKTRAVKRVTDWGYSVPVEGRRKVKLYVCGLMRPY